MLAREIEFKADRREDASGEADIRTEAAKANRAASLRVVEEQQFERGYN
jgi:hypothetical protein